MVKGMYEVSGNTQIARDTFKMTLKGDTGCIKAPGQFVNIELEGFYLRRPISISNWDEEGLTLIYKVVGGGTKMMAGLKTGAMLELLCPLGNGFDINAAKGKKAALIGGGVGVPPLIGLAQRLIAENIECFAVLGFADGGYAFGKDEFEKLGVNAHYASEDGSIGVKGYVTDALKGMEFDYYFTCGPHAMLKAVHRLSVPGQLSFEERMGCGFGACMGCTCKTLTGYKRICLDGPVMLSTEVSFDE